MPKRNSGFGIRKLKSGRFQLLIVDPVTRRQIGMGSYADRADAVREGQRIAIAQHDKMWHDPRPGEVPLADYLRSWLEESRRAGRHGAKHSVEATRAVEKYIVPTLGAMFVGDLRPNTIRRWYDQLVADQLVDHGRKNGLVAPKSYRILHAALNDAVRNEVIRTNPALVRSAARERSAERPYVEPAKVVTLAAAMPPWYSNVVITAAWCGLRFGELQRLRRSDIDLEHATMRVPLAKSDAGVRTINIPAPLLPVFVAQLEQWAQPGPDGRVFVGPKGGLLFGPTFGRSFRAARKRVELDEVTLHDCRHVFGSMLAEAGGTEREIQDSLGHRTHDASRRYIHADQRRQKDLANRLGERFTASHDPTPNAQPTRKPPESPSEIASDQDI